MTGVKRNCLMFIPAVISLSLSLWVHKQCFITNRSKLYLILWMSVGMGLRGYKPSVTPFSKLDVAAAGFYFILFAQVRLIAVSQREH